MFNIPTEALYLLGGLALLGILLGLYVVFWTNPHPGSTNTDSFIDKLLEGLLEVKVIGVIFKSLLVILYFCFKYALIAVFGIVVGGICLYSLVMMMFESFAYIMIPLYILLFYFIGHFIGMLIVNSRAKRELNTLHSREVARDMDEHPMVDEVARKIMNELPSKVDLRREGIYFYGKDACREWRKKYKYNSADQDLSEYTRDHSCNYSEPACYDSIIWKQTGHMDMGFVELHAFTASVGKRIKGYKMINEAFSGTTETQQPEDNFVPEGSTIFLQGSIDGDVYSFGPDGYPTSGSLPDYNSAWYNKCQFLNIEFEKLEDEIRTKLKEQEKEKSELKDWKNDNSDRRPGRHPFG